MPSRDASRLAPLLLVPIAVTACSGSDTTSATGPEPTGTTSAGGGGSGATGGTGGTPSTGGGGTGGTLSTGGAGGTTTTSTSGTGGSGAACSGFARRLGGEDPADEDRVGGAVVDAAGGAIVAGELSGTMQVGATTLVSAGGKDAFVVRLAESGAVAWATRFGSAYDDRVRAVAAMPDGGAIVAGTFDGAVDFGGTTLTSIAGPDAFVARLDGAGDVVFALQIESADARAVALEGDDVLVAGDFTGTTSFGGISLTSAQNDIFVARVTAGGAVTDAAQFTASAKPSNLAIASGAGRTYVAGSFQGTLDFGLGPLAGAGRDVFLARLDAGLGAVFASRFGDGTSQEARAVAVLSDGSAAMVGTFKGTMDLGGAVLVADTQEDAFVARVDEDGALVFALQFGDAAAQEANAIAVDGDDGLIVAGSFEGTIDPGSGPVTSSGGQDAFVTWLDPTGAAVKTERWGAGQDQRARAVSADPCGAVLVAGDFFGTLPFGDATLEATGGLDVFVGRVAP